MQLFTKKVRRKFSVPRDKTKRRRSRPPDHLKGPRYRIWG